MRLASPATIGDQSPCDPDRFRVTPILSDRARISFTNPHEVDGVWGHELSDLTPRGVYIPRGRKPDDCNFPQGMSGTTELDFGRHRTVDRRRPTGNCA